MQRIIIAIFMIAASVSAAYAQTAPAHDCDRLAAHPLDRKKAVPGVEWDEIDAEKAVPACEAAVREYPDEMRFAYQLARAVDRAGQTDRALALYQFLAAEGYLAAQIALGLIYVDGTGVPVDQATAAGWFQQAAERGHPEAQRLLGLMYAKGAGVPQDHNQALLWLQESAAQGYAQGQLALADLLYRDDESAEAQVQNQRAAEWYRRAAEQDELAAQAALGTLYEKGQGVERSIVHAYAWYALVAARDPTFQAAVDGLGKSLSPEELAEAKKQTETLRLAIRGP